VANLIVFIPKNGKKIRRNHKLFVFFSFSGKKICQVAQAAKIRHLIFFLIKKKSTATVIIREIRQQTEK